MHNTLFNRLQHTMRPISFTTILAILPLAPGAASAADDGLTLAQVVTCSFQGDNETFSKANRALDGGARKNADGYHIDGPVRSGKLCVENARVSGAFGAVATTASLCTADPEPLVEFVEAATGGLKKPAHPPTPGIVAAYEAPNYTLVIFRGEPGRDIKPDPGSRRLAYFCTYRGTGYQ